MTIPYKLFKQKAKNLSPTKIYRQLSGKKKFLLESAFQHEQKGKFSFIGANPYQEIIGKENTTTVFHHEKNKKENLQQKPLSYLKKHLPKLNFDLPFPFYGGAIGYVGYNSIQKFTHIGKTLTDDQHMPDIHFMLYKDVIVFDHTNNLIYLIVMNLDNHPETLLNKRLKKLQHALKENKNTLVHKVEKVDFQPEETKEAFIAKIKTAKAALQQKNLDQVVLSQRLQAKMNGDPLSFYQNLRKANASPYMFYIDFEDYLILGASPECLVQTNQDTVITNPIAGTRPRSHNHTKDDALAKDLLLDKKEIDEHQMLVELSKQDLSRVCEVGSISTPTYMTVEKYQHVMHIVSEVHGKLKSKCTSIDALQACLPAGTVSGSPKGKAMQLINQLEEKRRGVYGGGIGYINFNHNLNMALAIRSLIIKNDTAYLQVGAGIVRDSIPEKEYEETLHKARSLMEVSHFPSAHE